MTFLTSDNCYYASYSLQIFRILFSKHPILTKEILYSFVKSLMRCVKLKSTSHNIGNIANNSGNHTLKTPQEISSLITEILYCIKTLFQCVEVKKFMVH